MPQSNLPKRFNLTKVSFCCQVRRYPTCHSEQSSVSSLINTEHFTEKWKNFNQWQWRTIWAFPWYFHYPVPSTRWTRTHWQGRRCNWFLFLTVTFKQSHASGSASGDSGRSGTSSRTRMRGSSNPTSPSSSQYKDLGPFPPASLESQVGCHYLSTTGIFTSRINFADPPSFPQNNPHPDQALSLFLNSTSRQPSLRKQPLHSSESLPVNQIPGP